VLRDGHLDTGADETLFDPTIAASVGVDLTQAPERSIHLVGRGVIRCRYAAVTMRITDGLRETYEWSALVAFSPFRLHRSLLGFAGFLQFFNAEFRGADQEAQLLPNQLFPGQSTVTISSSPP
jgi:hypothetical protein